MQNKGFVKIFCGITHPGNYFIFLFSFCDYYHMDKAAQDWKVNTLPWFYAEWKSLFG